MKRAALGVLLVSLMAGSAAMAGQGFRPTPDHRDPPRASFNDHRHWNDHRDGNDHRNWDRDYDRFHRAPPPRVIYRPAPPRFGLYHAPRGYYQHTWRRGERLPVAYYAPSYLIGNYRDCGLRAPPRGYHWVRVNNDAVLAAVATGVVLDVAFHLFD
jgi:Ni/Co efflux regulator RcnB